MFCLTENKAVIQAIKDYQEVILQRRKGLVGGGAVREYGNRLRAAYRKAAGKQ
jgi:hypothetical protein